MKMISREIGDQLVNDVLKLVSIESITGNLTGIEMCQDEVIKIASRFGFDARKVADGKVIIVEPLGFTGVAKQGVVVHLDTVPFNENEWTHNPLGEISDGRLWGRGTIDDKMAVIQALYAVWLLSDEIEPSWQIIIGSDEEADWSDMQAFKSENNLLPEFLFTIDGDGVQNGSRGYLDLALEFERNSASRRITNIHVPNGANNSVPGTAFAEIDGKEIKVYGRACHSSIPESGDNALIKLCQRLGRPSEFSSFFELMNEASKKSFAEDLGFDISHQEDYTTIVPTMCSLVADKINLNLNIRLATGTTENDVLNAIKYIQQKFSCIASYENVIYPSFVSKKDKNIQVMAEAYKQIIGKSANVNIARGVGYNAALPNCVIFGPRFEVEDDEIDYCHAPDENRKIADIFKFLDMLIFYFRHTL